MADKLHALLRDRRRGARDACAATARRSGGVIIGAGAGTGLSAKCAEDGGADLIIIYNSGRYRMAGRGSLAGLMPYGDANAIVMEMAREVLPVVEATRRCWPASAAPTRSARWTASSTSIADAGFAGVQNFPTVGLIDGTFRANLEETGMGYGLEVDMIRTAALAGPADRAVRVRPRPGRRDGRGRRRRARPAHGPDHQGHDRRADGARRSTNASREIQAMRDAAVEVQPGRLVLCHGGPLAEPDDAAVRARAHRGRRRLLRRLEHGAPPGRDGDHRQHAPLQGADCVSPIGIDLNCSVVSDSACSTGRRSTLDAPTNPTAPVRLMT